MYIYAYAASTYHNIHLFFTGYKSSLVSLQLKKKQFAILQEIEVETTSLGNSAQCDGGKTLKVKRGWLR